MKASIEPQAGLERRAAQKLFRLHRPPPGPLHFHDADSAFATGNRATIVEQYAGLATPLPFGGAPDLDPNRLAFEHKFKPGARKRREPTNMIVHAAPGRPPNDAGLGAVDLGRIGDASFRLRLPRQQAAFEPAERPPHEIGAQPAEPVVQLAGRGAASLGGGRGAARALAGAGPDLASARGHVGRRAWGRAYRRPRPRGARRSFSASAPRNRACP